MDGLQHVRAKVREQRHALLHGRLEVEFAAHGALGDAGDPVAQADIACQLVQALLLDDGRLHVRDQQSLAARSRAGGNQIDVDGMTADGADKARMQRAVIGTGRRGEQDLSSLAVREPGALRDGVSLELGVYGRQHGIANAARAGPGGQDHGDVLHFNHALGPRRQRLALPVPPR